MENYYWKILHFEDLNIHQLHDIIQLREKVFVVEQDCVYLDLDGKDKDAYHAFAYNENDQMVATLRILKAGNYYKEVAIGRVCIEESNRGKQLARKIMTKSLDFISGTLNTNEVRISAQTYLTKFYESFNFKIVGEEYLEDGIPHIEMLRK